MLSRTQRTTCLQTFALAHNGCLNILQLSDTICTCMGCLQLPKFLGLTSLVLLCSACYPRNSRTQLHQMDQYSCQDWLWRLPQPGTPTSHATMVRQEQQLPIEGPRVPQVCIPLSPSPNLPRVCSIRQHLASPMASMMGSITSICTHAQLVLLLERYVL